MAVPMNAAGVRVVDPILTTHVQGYRLTGLVGEMLFPRVPVGVSGGKVLEFGKEAFRRYNARRTPGSATRRVQFGYEGKPFALVQDSLEAPVPREWQRDASQVPGIDLGKRAVNLTQNVLLRQLEEEQAGIATKAANYDANHKITLAGADKWSADTGKPLKDIKEGKEAVRATIGMRPNTLILSPGAWSAASENPSVLERFKYTSSEAVALADFAKLVEIERVAVADGVFADDEDTFGDIWGNAAILAYVPPAPSGQEEPSFGYTYTMEGNPLVEAPYYDNNAKSWIYGCTFERAPVLTGMLAGFLIQNPG